MKAVNSKAFLAFICYGDLAGLQRIISESGIDMADYCLQTAPPKEMPDLLGAADIGILFRKDDTHTKMIPSPIKFAEYLSCGLPIVINPGVGDSSEIVAKYDVGVLVDPADPIQLRSGAEKILEMVRSDTGLYHRCRETAQKELSLDSAEQRYLDCYRRVARPRK
jgi:glycosyltransferase involved in cell wall biosynthesis